MSGIRTGLTVWALCVLTAACTKSAPAPATQIVVAITSDLLVGTELARIEIKVSKRDGTDVVSTQKLTLVGKSPQPGEATLPVSFAIGKGKESSFLLVVSGYGPLGSGGAEAKVVEQRSIATFQSGKTLLLEVRLARVCLNQLCNNDPHMVCYLSDMGIVNAGECGEIPTLGKDDLKIVDPAKLAKLVMMSGSGGTGGEGTSGAGGQSSTAADAGASGAGGAGGTGGGSGGGPETGGSGGGGIGTGGTAVSMAGTSGTLAGTGGLVSGTGGVVSGTGGTLAGTGGTLAGTGGMGTGGSGAPSAACMMYCTCMTTNCATWHFPNPDTCQSFCAKGSQAAVTCWNTHCANVPTMGATHCLHALGDGTVCPKM